MTQQSFRVLENCSTRVAASTAFAEFCLRSGIEAHFGTYCRDTGTATFATDVYSALTSGATLDDAVKQARTKLHDSKNNKWSNYILYGNGAFRLKPARQ